MKKDKGQGTEKGKAWLKREMRPYRPFILFLTALTVAGTLLSLAFAYLTRYLVNSASEKDGKRLILFAAHSRSDGGKISLRKGPRENFGGA